MRPCSLYRVLYGPSTADVSDATQPPVPYDLSQTSLSGLIGDDAAFHVERLAIKGVSGTKFWTVPGMGVAV